MSRSRLPWHRWIRTGCTTTVLASSRTASTADGSPIGWRRSRVHDTFTEDDREFIDRCSMFFLATADADGWPDCSYKGGEPGFVHVLDDRTLAFPSYDGNGMFRSLGNVLGQSQGRVAVHRFRAAQPDAGQRHRVAARRCRCCSSTFEGAQLVVRVRARRIFPNCPRYIHRMALVERSVYSPSPWPRAAGARLEADGRLPRLPSLAVL